MTARKHLLAVAGMITACGSSRPIQRGKDPTANHSIPAAPQRERRATLRLDPSAPGNLWLEVGRAKLVVDDSENQLWRSFAGRDVIVTGECYLDGEHFRIHTLRVADPTTRGVGTSFAGGSGSYVAVGPQQTLEGELTMSTAPPGSKLAGSSQQVFIAGGAHYGVAGPYIVGLNPGPWRLRVRVLTPDMSYVARSLDHDIWIVGLAQPLTGVPDARPCVNGSVVI